MPLASPSVRKRSKKASRIPVLANRKCPKSERELAQCLPGGTPLMHDQVEGRDEARAVGSRFAVQDCRIAQPLEEFLRSQNRVPVRRAARADNEFREFEPEAFADFLLQLPGAVLSTPTQVHDSPNALSLQPFDLVGRRLRRPPQPVGDPVLVEIEQPKDAVIDKEHVRPCAQPPCLACNRLVPARDAGHSPRVAQLVL